MSDQKQIERAASLSQLAATLFPLSSICASQHYCQAGPAVMWGRISRRHRRDQIARARTVVGPTTFPSRDWPTAPPAPPHEAPQREQKNMQRRKNLIKAPSKAQLGFSLQQTRNPRPSLPALLCSPSPDPWVPPPPSDSPPFDSPRPRTTRLLQRRKEEQDGGGDAAGRRRLLRGAQQADFAPHHRRRRGRLRRRQAVPRCHAPPAGFLYVVAPCAAGRVHVGSTGLHVVPPRRQLRRQQQRRRRRQGVAAAAAAAVRQQGHRRVHPAVHARLGPLQAEGQELERLQGAQGAGAGRERRRRRHARQETRLTKKKSGLRKARSNKIKKGEKNYAQTN